MRKLRKLMTRRIGLVAVAVLLAAGVLPQTAYGADDSISISHTGGFNVVQGDGIYIDVESKVLTGNTDYSLHLTSSDSDISIVTGSSGVFAGGTNQPMTFAVKVAKKASAGDHKLSVKAIAEDGKGTVITDKSITLSVARSQDSYSSLGRAAFDVDYSVAGGDTLIAGKTQTLKLSLFNRGNTVIKNARISLSLPDGLSIASGAATINAGYLSIGSTYVAEYPIAVDVGVVSKSYPVTVKIAGLDSSNDDASLEETVYIPVSGVGGSGSLDLEISGVQAPASVSAGADFTVSFDVVNKSASDAVNVKAVLVQPEGVINKTKNVFLIDRIPAGGKTTCSVSLNARQGGQYALFEITAGSADGSQSVSQYAGTMISGGGGSANPQLMVSAYSYGGQPVSAGSRFILSLTLNNTSTGTALQNIKVTVSSDDSAFLPVGTSNAFYVASIPAGSSYVHPMRLEAQKDAEQKTSMVTINMSYEDTAGGTHTASDIISIPVVQETRLVIDDILDPGYLTADQMGYLNVNYYNMGKTQLSNLRISVEGDFSVDGSATMYMGNMTSGKSDYYSVNFFPNGPGPLNGKVIFTFEDAAGDERTVEKHFTFQVGEAMIWDGDMDEPMPDYRPSGGMSVWKTAAIFLAAGGAAFGAAKYKKSRKRKRDEEFDLDE